MDCNVIEGVEKGPQFLFYFNVTLWPVLSSAFGYSNSVRSSFQHSDIRTCVSSPISSIRTSRRVSGPISSIRRSQHICPVQSPTFAYSNIVLSNLQHSGIRTCVSGPISSIRLSRYICLVQSPALAYSNIVRSNLQHSEIPTYMSGPVSSIRMF